MGILRFIAAASPASATIHLPLGSNPASSNNKARGIPVHSLHEMSPWIAPQDFWGGSAAALKKLLPEHSKKAIRLTVGYRNNASTENCSDLRTRPWMSNACWAGPM